MRAQPNSIAALQQQPAAPEVPRLSYRIAELCEATGICRSRLYEEIAAGRLRTVKLGRCTLVMAEDAQAFLAKLRSAAA